MKAKLSWHNEKRKVKDLIPYEGNPRQMDEKQAGELTKSVQKFNLVEIPAINTDNQIVAGHQRIEVLKRLGREDEEIEVRVPSRKLSETEAREYLLRSNRNVGSWNWDLLANFDEQLLLDVGFTPPELDNVFGLDLTDDFSVTDETEKLLKGGPLRTALGQLWALGAHKLIIGDSTDRANWERLMGNEKFDFLYSDPPYRLAYSNKRTRKVKTKDGFKLKREREYAATGATDKSGKPKFAFGMKGNRTYQGVEMKRGVPEFDEWFSIAHDYENPKGANVMIFENWKNTRELWNAMEKYWKVMNMVIWHLPNRMQGFTRPDALYNKYDIALMGEGKPVPMNGEREEELEAYLAEKGQKLLDSYEVILYGHGGPKTTKEDIKARGKEHWGKVSDHITWTGGSEVSTGQGLVFGTKPLQILTPYLKVFSPRGGVIAEPFGGSGSTLIASEIMKRRCRAIELSPLYAEVILRRWEKFTGKRAELITL